VPSTLPFVGDAAAQAAFDLAITRLARLGGTPVTIDFAPLAEAAALLYESALVAERYTAIRSFFDAHEGEVMEPVRSIIAAGRNYSAADLYETQTKLRALGQQADAMWQGIDVLLVPTAPTHYTIAQCRLTRLRSTATWARTPTSSTCSITPRCLCPAACAPTACPLASP
jgi:allophanate hydrolase